MVVAARLVIMLLAPAAALLPVRYVSEDCGDTSTHGKFLAQATVPDRPTTGDNVYVINRFKLDMPIYDGQFKSAVSWKGLPLRHKKGPLCGSDTSFPVHLGLLKVADVIFHGLQCPSQNPSGVVSVQYSVKLAQWLPPSIGNSAFKMTGQSTNGDKLFCLKVKILVKLLDSQSNATNASLGFSAPLAQADNDESANGGDIHGDGNMNGHDNGVNVDVNVLGVQMKENAESANVNIDGKNNSNGHDNGVNVDVNVYGVQLKEDKSTRSMPKAASSQTPNDVNANSVIDGNNNFNGHDNGVNVNVNVLGIQDKENVESANGGNIRGDGNMNGHDNGVNVNVNVLGIQKLGNNVSTAQMVMI